MKPVCPNVAKTQTGNFYFPLTEENSRKNKRLQDLLIVSLGIYSWKFRLFVTHFIFFKWCYVGGFGDPWRSPGSI